MNTMKNDTATRYVGNCQICERDQKLAGGVMVHHGYKRPGHGEIVGDCYGVAGLPYEVSCDLLKTYKVQLEAIVVSSRAYLVELESGAVTRLTDYTENYRTGRSEIVEHIAGVTSPYQWQRALESRIWNTKQKIRVTQDEVDRCTRRIAAWTLKPVRTFQEELVKVQAAKAERAAIVAAERAARQAKKDATAAKAAALEARRQAVKDGFRTRLEALAARPGTIADKRPEVVAILVDLAKKKNDFIGGLYQLDCAAACFALGIAVPGDNGRPVYENYWLTASRAWS